MVDERYIGGMSSYLFPSLIFLVLFVVAALGLVIARELDNLRKAEWEVRRDRSDDDDV